MNQYAILCTEEQAKRALDLGAPIDIEPYDNPHRVPQKFPKIIVKYPTAEEMLGWLEKQGIICDIFPLEESKKFAFRIDENWNEVELNTVLYEARKDATLAAINASLEYLEKRL